MRFVKLLIIGFKNQWLKLIKTRSKMKNILVILFSSLCLTASSQTVSSEDVKQTILDFFKAFHQQDTTALRSMVKEGIVMQTIVKDEEGKATLNTTEFSNFLKSIASIPKQNTFEEKLLDFTIQVDGDMANAWTPYEFWYNGTFSHCGVNSFQLMKQGEGWKIIYLIDTRRRSNCNKP